MKTPGEKMVFMDQEKMESEVKFLFQNHLCFYFGLRHSMTPKLYLTVFLQNNVHKAVV